MEESSRLTMRCFTIEGVAPNRRYGAWIGTSTFDDISKTTPDSGWLETRTRHVTVGPLRTASPRREPGDVTHDSGQHFITAHRFEVSLMPERSGQEAITSHVKLYHFKTAFGDSTRDVANRIAVTDLAHRSAIQRIDDPGNPPNAWP